MKNWFKKIKQKFSDRKTKNKINPLQSQQDKIEEIKPVVEKSVSPEVDIKPKPVEEKSEDKNLEKPKTRLIINSNVFFLIMYRL